MGDESNGRLEHQSRREVARNHSEPARTDPGLTEINTRFRVRGIMYSHGAGVFRQIGRQTERVSGEYFCSEAGYRRTTEKAMFKNILIPTDGSRSANKAVKKGFQLAKQLGAKVTGYYAVEAMPPHVYEEGYSIGGNTMVKALERRALETGQAHLERMAKLAAESGVAYSGVVGKAETPYEGIIQAAKKSKCDAIVMASHGRHGLADLLMGSVTHKVLTHSKLPVLVFR